VQVADLAHTMAVDTVLVAQAECMQLQQFP
jgi:hypothetical protein